MPALIGHSLALTRLEIVPFIAHATNFDGTNDFLNRGADLTGNSNSQVGIASFWLKFDSTTSSNEFVYDNTSGRFIVNWTAGETVRISGRNTGNTTILDLITTNTYTSADAWTHFLFSWNLASPGSARLYVDDVSDLNEVLYTDDTIDYTRVDHSVGAQVDGTNIFGACISELYLTFAETLDFNTESNRRLFYSGARPVNLGSDGSLPTGNQPIVYLRNPSSSFETNLGSGGNFVVTGALTDCADSPSE